MSRLAEFDGIARDMFVETGTGLADTLIEASRCPGFRELHSIERDPKLAKSAAKLFKKTPHVHVHQGASVDWLPKILDTSRETTIWLDAHWSGGLYGEARPPVECPLLDEIAVIRTLDWETPPILLIDDACMFGDDDWWRTSPYANEFDRSSWPTTEQIAVTLEGWPIGRIGNVLWCGQVPG